MAMYQRKITIEDIATGTKTFDDVVDMNVVTLDIDKSSKVTLEITDFNGNVSKASTLINIADESAGLVPGVGGNAGAGAGGAGGGAGGAGAGGHVDFSSKLSSKTNCKVMETKHTFAIIMGTRADVSVSDYNIVDNPFSWLMY